jgi:hypothetical protein
MGKKSREKRQRIGRLMGLTGWDDIQSIAYLKYAKVERRKLGVDARAVNSDPQKFYKRIIAAPTLRTKGEAGGEDYVKSDEYRKAVDNYHKTALLIRKYLKPWKKEFNPI